MAGRDRVAEVVAYKARRKVRRGNVSWELDTLVRDWDKGAGKLAPSPDLVVIRTATLLEVFTKFWIGELIDAGEPYIERAQTLIPGGLKFDYPLACALAGQKLSVGELMAHVAPCNQLGDIIRSLSALVDCDIVAASREMYSRYEVEINGEDPVFFITDEKKMRASLARMFTCRHIVVHELPDDPPYDVSEVDEFLSSASEFVNAVEECLTRKVHGMTPLTQSAMNIEAGDRAREAYDELDALLTQVARERPDPDFDAAQTAWETYRAAEAEFRSGYRHGGTIRSALIGRALEEITRERIKAVKGILDGDYDLGD